MKSIARITHLVFVLAFVANCNESGLTSLTNNPDMLTTSKQDLTPISSLTVELSSTTPSAKEVIVVAAQVPVLKFTGKIGQQKNAPLNTLSFYDTGIHSNTDVKDVELLGEDGLSFGGVTLNQQTGLYTFDYLHFSMPASTIYSWTLFANFQAQQAGGQHNFELVAVKLEDDGMVYGLPVKGNTIALVPGFVVMNETAKSRDVRVGERGVVLNEFWFDHTMPLDIKHLFGKIVSMNHGVYIVGSKGTHYFQNLRILDTSNGMVVAGPYTPTVPNDFVSTGTFAFADSFTYAEKQKLWLIADLADHEDAPGEFIGQIYFATAGDEDSNPREFFHMGDACNHLGGFCYSPSQIGNNVPHATTINIVK